MNAGGALSVRGAVQADLESTGANYVLLVTIQHAHDTKSEFFLVLSCNRKRGEGSRKMHVPSLY
jgi:hypothetical protein